MFDANDSLMNGTWQLTGFVYRKYSTKEMNKTAKSRKNIFSLKTAEK